MYGSLSSEDYSTGAMETYHLILPTGIIYSGCSLSGIFKTLLIGSFLYIRGDHCPFSGPASEHSPTAFSSMDNPGSRAMLSLDAVAPFRASSPCAGGLTVKVLTDRIFPFT